MQSKAELDIMNNVNPHCIGNASDLVDQIYCLNRIPATGLAMDM